MEKAFTGLLTGQYQSGKTRSGIAYKVLLVDGGESGNPLQKTVVIEYTLGRKKARYLVESSGCGDEASISYLRVIKKRAR